MKYTVRPEISLFRQLRVSDKTPPMKPGKKALRACLKCGCYETFAGMTVLCCRVTIGQDSQFDRKDEGEPSCRWQGHLEAVIGDNGRSAAWRRCAVFYVLAWPPSAATRPRASRTSHALARADTSTSRPPREPTN